MAKITCPTHGEHEVAADDIFRHAFEPYHQPVEAVSVEAAQCPECLAILPVEK